VQPKYGDEWSRSTRKIVVREKVFDVGKIAHRMVGETTTKQRQHRRGFEQDVACEASPPTPPVDIGTTGTRTNPLDRSDWSKVLAAYAVIRTELVKKLNAGEMYIFNLKTLMITWSDGKKIY
jgi:hypothetical protein